MSGSNLLQNLLKQLTPGKIVGVSGLSIVFFPATGSAAALATLLSGIGMGVTGGHKLHVARTFALSYKQLNPEQETDAPALALLARAACLAPGEPIPRALLLATLGDDLDRYRAADAVRRLTALGLLDVEASQALLLHRLVAAFVPQNEAARAAVEQAVLGELASRLDRAGYLGPLPDIELHVRAVTDAVRYAANLCNRLGYYLKQIGAYEGALLYYGRAL